MKNAKLTTGVFTLLIFTAFCTPTTTTANGAKYYPINPITLNTAIQDHLIGGWAYTVEGAPEGWEKGLLLIINEDGTYKAQVQTGGGTLLGQNISVKKKSITFDVNVEGQMVAVALTMEGSKLSGTSTSSDGIYKINGVKSLSME